MSQDDKTSTIQRLNRIEGQVRGITRLVDEGRYCMDVLHQVQAVKAAISKVEDGILSEHAASCVEAAIASGDSAEQREKFDELVALIGKVKR